jgi:hypothetical protein
LHRRNQTFNPGGNQMSVVPLSLDPKLEPRRFSTFWGLDGGR